jgi:hypothetical protein
MIGAPAENVIFVAVFPPNGSALFVLFIVGPDVQFDPLKLLLFSMILFGAYVTTPVESTTVRSDVVEYDPPPQKEPRV